ARVAGQVERRPAGIHPAALSRAPRAPRAAGAAAARLAARRGPAAAAVAAPAPPGPGGPHRGLGPGDGAAAAVEAAPLGVVPGRPIAPAAYPARVVARRPGTALGKVVLQHDVVQRERVADGQDAAAPRAGGAGLGAGAAVVLGQAALDHQ